MAIRRELCDEAIRLATILRDIRRAKLGNVRPVALMHLHAARMTARQDSSGGLLLLEEQDRELGPARDSDRIGVVSQNPRRAIAFPVTTRRRGSRRNTALPPSFQETRWDKVVECYALLSGWAPSALQVEPMR